jgi:S1-C subfamily serine protease
VVDALRALPPNPEPGEAAAIALVFTEIKTGNSGHAGGAIAATIRGYWPLTNFKAPEFYYGDPLPDVAFVHLNVRGVPPLELATEPWAARVGTRIATAGFPLGDAPLTAYGAVNQITPVLRHGIISSVFPFPCPYPHGFTVDILTQGGASGSPIFLTDSPRVVGLLYAGFDGTNLTFAVPSEILKGALDSLLGSTSIDLEGVPTLQELTASALGHSNGTV